MSSRFQHVSLLIGGLALSLALAACESMSGTGQSGNGDQTISLPADRDATDLDPAMANDHCVPPGIPSSATIALQGTGEELSYRAESDGTLYVYGGAAGQVLWSGRVVRGQELLLSPENGQLTLDGRPLLDERLNSGEQYIIFFDGGRTGIDRGTN